jgi:hypothetical protein
VNVEMRREDEPAAAGAQSSPRLVAPRGPNQSGAPAPTFSVVIATYQSAKTVGDAVASALEQTLPPLEVIVCDDGSTDATEQALSPYRGRIVLLRQANGGEAAAKNAGILASQGDYVAVLDADDLFLPNRLEALASAACARPDLDILTTDAYLEVAGQTMKRCYQGGMRFAVDDQRRGILERNFIFGQVAVRRSRLLEVGGFDEALRWATDWDCWIRMIFTGSQAGLVDEPLGRYRLSSGSLSAQRARLIGGRVQVLEKALRRPDLAPAEHHVAARSLAENCRLLTLLRAREALVEATPGARRLLLDVALGSGFGLRTRAKALVAILAPASCRKLLLGRRQETTAELMLPPQTPPDAR